MVLPNVDTFDVHELLPKYDCGLCRNPVCMTFARNILLETQKPNECGFLAQENLNKIQDMLPVKEIIQKHAHPNVDEDIIEINPCTEEGMVTLETQLKSKFTGTDLYSDYFDQYQLCNCLSVTDIFDSVSCSSKMGYALVEIKGKRIHIFKTGKIIMRRADNREDALNTFSKISGVLLPGKLCSCANVLADCFAGGCEICSEEVCAAILDDIKGEKIEGDTTIKNVLENGDIASDEKLSDNFTILGKMATEIRKLDEEIKKGSSSQFEDSINKIDELVKKVNKACIEGIIEGEVPASTIIALTQYGLGRDLIRAKDGFLSLKDQERDEHYEVAKALLFDAYDAFKKRDITASEAIHKRYREFVSNWDENLPPVGIAKIATNGFYISRILGKPVPKGEQFNLVKN